MIQVAQPRSPLRIVIGTPRLSSLFTVERGMTPLLLTLGSAGLFAAGVAEHTVGDAAPWYLLAAVLIGCALRAVDLENCALFIPGGLYGTARQAFGRPTARLAAAVLIVEQVLFGALAAGAAGHSLVAVLRLLRSLSDIPYQISLDDLSSAGAAFVIGASWLWLRQGRVLADAIVRRTVTAVTVGLTIFVAGHLAAIGVAHDAVARLAAPFTGRAFPFVGALTAIGACAFATGTVEAFGQASTDFPQPRIRNLRRAARVVNGYSLLVTAGSGFLFVLLVPAAERSVWYSAPLASIAWFDALPRWVGLPLVVVIAAAATLFLALAVYRSAARTQELLLRLSEDGLLTRAMRALHPRFGTPSRLIDLVAIAQLAAVLASAGQLAWLARAYGVGVACGAILKIAALVRLRVIRSEARASRVPFNLRVGRREWPLGLLAVAVLVAVPTALLVASGDPPALAGGVLLVAVVAVLSASERLARTSAPEVTRSAPDIELLAPPVVGIDHVHARPGSVLVPIRKPGALAHLASALQGAVDRDVIVVTVRLVGVDASEELVLNTSTTEAERRLLMDAAMLAERSGRAVRLLIVPGKNVFDAIATTVARLAASEVYVGESETLSDADQARLLGEAWERVPPPKPLDVRLLIRHGSGRITAYHVGAHAPALGSDDLHLIHELWLDVIKTTGHVHHHDVVRAALILMQEHLNNGGDARDAALDLVRRVARPGDELAAVVRQRDFVRLRDMVRNRPASDLATALTDLTPEDQVVAFRVLPRKVAAATFEYLTHEAQQTLLKAMAQEDIAAILNEMAPDDRTMFLEELPATATQQLLTLLTPEERAVASTLLGYPDGSIGRLMTPDYIAVREQWTVQQVLDHIRTHGQDSETLNVIYVVDDHGVLIDDIRIRELLLISPDHRMADVMDRRFVALNAADDQNTAVTVFRREDRSALPVTDSTGVLIGIVTIDDVLDVAEAAATKEIQRIGGSEALDEPYMQIAFSRMIQKRAGWLTALFLGEMLTATAMGAFEREIERAVVLALFVPLIISSGGNSGSQASTLVIRAIALGEVRLRDWWLVMRREIAAGLVLGSILGTIGFLRITIWSAFSSLYGPHWMLVATTVGLALVGVVLWGTLIGSLLPFLLRRLGFDPAASSAPFVATLVDVTGLIIYFSVGLVVLRGTLL
jgi:magnesium transporter